MAWWLKAALLVVFVPLGVIALVQSVWMVSLLAYCAALLPLPVLAAFPFAVWGLSAAHKRLTGSAY
jgi:hypothetical protein